MPIVPEPRPAEGAQIRTILVVEDEALVRLGAAEELRDYGFEVREAANGTQALGILEQERVDLVFTDVHMPGEPNGFGLVRWIRDHMPHLPVILTSADADIIRAARHTLRNESFFAKPYDIAAVAAQIHGLLGGGVAGASGAA